MSCVREASPPPSDDHLRHDMKKRSFLQPLRGLRRIFRRKGRLVNSLTDSQISPVNGLGTGTSNENLNVRDQGVDSNLEPAKSHSTSHLDDDQTDCSQRRNLQTALSVSHDSIFSPEQRTPNSGSETVLYGTSRLGFPHSSVRAELFEAVRKRRTQGNNASDDEEDLGLPRSPVSNSPTTTADDMFTKEHIVTKSSQSTCSDGSLLSMGSFEIDEESYYHSSRHSSKLSLYDKRTSTGSDLQNNDRSTNSSTDDAASLSHSAAKHKMAVKPKRKHGAPQKKRQLITSNTLPTTPELNEENGLKNNFHKDKSVADSRHSDEHQTNQNHFFKTHGTEHHTSVTQIIASECTTPVASSKPWSLLVGDSPNPTSCQETLSRNKSSDKGSQPIAASASHRNDDVSDVKESTKKEEGGASFFSRLLLRRSSKKKKNAIDEPDLSGWKAISNELVSLPSHKEESTSMVYANGGLMNAVKHHPLFRQRVESSNLVSPEDVALPSMSYSSTVPVNMTEVNMVDSVSEGRQRTVHKSHSFRNSEKLPYVWCEDTPSLPVHIGLIDESNTEDTFPKRYSSSTTNTSFANVEPSNTCEPTVIQSDVNHWKWSSTTNEYEDTSTINRLNISVNEEDDIIIDMKSDKVANSNIAQIPDVKIPVPAPRTSLLKQSPSHLQSIERETNIEVKSESVNVTVTESDEGRKSVISIGSSSAIADNDSNECTSEPENVVSYEEPLPEMLEDIVKGDELDDDVFQPAAESTMIATNFPIGNNESVCVGEAETIWSAERPGSLTDVEPKIERTSSIDEKHKYVDTERKRSNDEKGEILELPPKPVIVTDFGAGIVKVNDTIVHIRKKSRDIGQHSKKDEEPELMKVFARRSLKVKETDDIEQMLQDTVKSRDSDKENEDTNAPLQKTKTMDTVSSNAVQSKPVFSKFQRNFSHEPDKVVLAANVNENRQRCKSIPSEMEKCEKLPTSVPKNECPPTVAVSLPLASEDKGVTPFKRIQQRREEWEKRAQQAMKIHGTK